MFQKLGPFERNIYEMYHICSQKYNQQLDTFLIVRCMKAQVIFTVSIDNSQQRDTERQNKEQSRSCTMRQITMKSTVVQIMYKKLQSSITKLYEHFKWNLLKDIKLQWRKQSSPVKAYMCIGRHTFDTFSLLDKCPTMLKKKKKDYEA